MRQDYYAVLGITPTASAEEIRQAFRQRARQFHPDATAGDPAAADHFKVVSEAYRVLGTPDLRAAYDRALQMLTPPGAGMRQAPAQPGEQPPVSGPGRSRVTLVQEGLHHEGAGPTPALAIRVTPAQTTLVPPREQTRFYLLTELGATRENAVLGPLPLDLALTIDRSSSMKGKKIFGIKQAVRNMLDHLQVDDRLTLVFFDDKADVLADGEGVQGRAGIEIALDNLVVKGGTEIASGLATTLERLAARQTRARVASLVLLTDGQTYGDEEKCRDLASMARDMGVSITALGLGTDWNRELLDRLAAISGGSSNFVEEPEHIQPVFEDALLRLRATLAAGMRLTLEPAPGVRITRATRVAPDIAEGFGASSDVLTQTATGTAPVTVDLGALVGRPDSETAAVMWEVLLDPAALAPINGTFLLGRLSATYWAPRPGGGQTERLEQLVRVPVNARPEHAPIQTDVRLALELITAYRLQAQADALKASGQAAEAAKRMNTAALRLRSAGSNELAEEALRAARELGGGGVGQGVTETLRVKYGTKNLGIFHRLRSRGKVG